MKNLIFIVCFLLEMTLAQRSILRCPIKFYSVDPYNWSNLWEGYLLGLHKDTMERKKCLECKLFGENMAGINRGIVYIDKFRNRWMDKERVTKADVYHVTGILLEIYKIFMILLRPMDNIT